MEETEGIKLDEDTLQCALYDSELYFICLARNSQEMFYYLLNRAPDWVPTFSPMFRLYALSYKYDCFICNKNYKLTVESIQRRRWSCFILIYTNKLGNLKHQGTIVQTDCLFGRHTICYNMYILCVHSFEKLFPFG